MTGQIERLLFRLLWAAVSGAAPSGMAVIAAFQDRKPIDWHEIGMIAFGGAAMGVAGWYRKESAFIEGLMQPIPDASPVDSTPSQSAS